MLISCSPTDKNQVVVIAQIPKESTNKGIHCGNWVKSVIPIIDGPNIEQWKGGKNNIKAEVQGRTMSDVSKAIDAAIKYMQTNYKL